MRWSRNRSLDKTTTIYKHIQKTGLLPVFFCLVPGLGAGNEMTIGK